MFLVTSYMIIMKMLEYLQAELGKTETLVGEDDDGLFDIADMEYDTLFSLP